MLAPNIQPQPSTPSWTPAQQALRDEWGLDALDADPEALLLVDVMDAYRPAIPQRSAHLEAKPATVQECADNLERHLREVPRERALLALTDPMGELYAVEPLSEFRARQILIEAAEADHVERVRNAVPHSRLPLRSGNLETGRDLLTRLGADPAKASGVIPCPAHEDERPSLSWKLAGDRALLHCFAGCDFRAIVAAVA